ncbi:thiamine-monophosphate kinase [Luteolibacter algae]|uniref:Thiamine-monophosphate kinase n=1 Tax=Luteolibacter algae TaxID=454151 RepID=A0ABW5DC54_9BACT
MKTLGEIGEDSLISRLITLVPVADQTMEGPGDDCAVIDDGRSGFLLLKTDALVEGVHYERSADPLAVGWKAIARVISDFAAMGGKPERFLVTVALPKSLQLDWIENFYRGMGNCMSRYGAVLAGGETCRVPEGSAAVISISATGSVSREQLVLRSGGRSGDEIWVTGRLGGSISGKHLSFLPRVEQAAWLTGNFALSAMMDLSDGIASDLPRLAKASGCGFQIDEDAVPLNNGCTVQQALTDGEDFELLFTLADSLGLPESWRSIFPDIELTRIGTLVAENQGRELSGGWDHFS